MVLLVGINVAAISKKPKGGYKESKTRASGERVMRDWLFIRESRRMIKWQNLGRWGKGKKENKW